MQCAFVRTLRQIRDCRHVCFHIRDNQWHGKLRLTRQLCQASEGGTPNKDDEKAKIAMDKSHGYKWRKILLEKAGAEVGSDESSELQKNLELEMAGTDGSTVESAELKRKNLTPEKDSAHTAGSLRHKLREALLEKADGDDDKEADHLAKDRLSSEFKLQHSAALQTSDRESEDQKLKRQERARQALNRLLQSVAQEAVEPKAKSTSEVKLPRPRPTAKVVDKMKELKQEKAKQVAGVSQDIKEAFTEVAKSLGGEVERTKSELLSAVLSTSKENSTQLGDLSELFAGMKIESEPVVVPTVSSVHMGRHRRLFKKQFRQEADRILFRERPLGIFQGKVEKKQVSSFLTTWDFLHREELQLTVTSPPNNALEEMILWTNQGKLWQFPIDNEFGLDEEKKVGFHEHIFLDHYLEGWCPKRGPIRHFMELVTTGLSKNPYITVERKKAHIEWYRRYFEEKGALVEVPVSSMGENVMTAGE